MYIKSNSREHDWRSTLEAGVLRQVYDRFPGLPVSVYTTCDGDTYRLVIVAYSTTRILVSATYDSAPTYDSAVTAVAIFEREVLTMLNTLDGMLQVV